MNMLWLGIALITFCVLAVIALPILRHRKINAALKDRFEYDVALYEDQLKEVDHDLERGLLTSDQADAVRTEIQRKLLWSADHEGNDLSDTPFLTSSYSAIYTLAAIALFLSIGAISTYSFFGSPELRNIAYIDRDIKQEETALAAWQAGQDMDALLNQLARRMEERPGDIKGWKMLGRSLIARGRYEESVTAYKHAVDLRPNDPELVVDYAEARIFTNEGIVDKAALEILQEIFNAAPANPKIRYYIGLSKAQNDDLPGALQDWTDIAAISPKDAPWMPTVRQQMDVAFSKTGIVPSSLKPSAKALEIAAAMDVSPAPGPTVEDMAAARQMPVEDQADMINSMVKRLAGKLEANPNNPEGWARLGRSYQTLNRYEESKQAYLKAYKQAPDNIDIALAYGETLVLIDQGYVSPSARALFEQILSTDPENVKARFYFGVALAETREETPRAIQIWEALLKDLPDGAPWTASLIEQIKRAKEVINKKAS